MRRTFVAEGDPIIGLSIYECCGDNEKLIDKQRFDIRYCRLCGKKIEKSYRVFYEDNEGNISDVTLNRQGALCESCARKDMADGITPPYEKDVYRT